MVAALDGTRVYVAQGAVSFAPQEAIEQRLRALGSGTMVVVVPRLPVQFGSAAALARACRASFPFSDAAIVVVCDSPRAIAVDNSGLDKSALADVVEEAATSFDSEGYPAGIAQLVGTIDNRRHVAAVRRTEQLGGPALLFLVLVLAGGYGLWQRVRRAETGAASPQVN